MSNFLTLDGSDLKKGLATAMFGGATSAVVAIIGAAGFDLFNANWKKIGMLIIAGAIVSGASYLQKNFFTDKQGNVLGVSMK